MQFEETVEIEIVVTEDAKTYEFASGADGQWTSGSTKALEFVVKADRDDEATFDNFVGIKVDGVDVPEKDDDGKAHWTAKKGSVIIDLQPAYLFWVILMAAALVSCVGILAVLHKKREQ